MGLVLHTPILKFYAYINKWRDMLWCFVKQKNYICIYPRQISGLGVWSTCPPKSLSSYEPRHNKTNKMSVRPAKTQISMGICPVWSESSPCAELVAKDRSFLHADSEDPDQTGRMPRLIWVFAGRTAILLVLSCRGSYFHYTVHSYKILCKAKKKRNILLPETS